MKLYELGKYKKVFETMLGTASCGSSCECNYTARHLHDSRPIHRPLFCIEKRGQCIGQRHSTEHVAMIFLGTSMY